jgi:hypothetical protein
MSKIDEGYFGSVKRKRGARPRFSSILGGVDGRQFIVSWRAKNIFSRSFSNEKPSPLASGHVKA